MYIGLEVDGVKHPQCKIYFMKKVSHEPEINISWWTFSLDKKKLFDMKSQLFNEHYCSDKKDENFSLIISEAYMNEYLELEERRIYSSI